MTVLYRLDAPAADLALRFAAWADPADPWAGGTIAPGNFAPVVTAGREFVAGPRPAGWSPRRLVPRLWGVPPPPSAAYGSRPVLTVRNPDSPFWIGNLRNSEFRCLVPASAFMVWDGRSSGGTDYEGRRLRHWFGRADGAPAVLAGVWKDSEIPTFAIVTCPAGEAVRAIGRDTAPVVLADEEAQRAWLHAGWDRAKALIDARDWPLAAMPEPIRQL